MRTSLKRTADVVVTETALLLELSIEDMRPLLGSNSQLMCNFVKFAESQLCASCSNRSRQVPPEPPAGARAPG